MNKLLNFFIQRSFVVNLISIFIIFAGITLGSMLKRDTTPPLEFKEASIRIKLPGASATEVEKHLAFPVESALQGLPHATEIETHSSLGSLKVNVYFRAGHKGMMESIEQIRSRISAISWQLPQQSRDIEVKQEKVDSVFHMGIALKGFEETNTEHRLLAKKISDEIQNLPGMISTSLDMNQQNLYVKLNPKALIRNEISIGQIRSKIMESLNFTPIGQVSFKEKTYSIEMERPAEASATLKNLAIRGNRNGDILTLGELADISLEVDEIKETSRFNGQPVISLWTQKDISSDTIELKKKVQKIIDRTNKNLPDGLEAVVFIDAPRFIQKQLETLNTNGLFGLILVLVILTLFFNWKVAVATSFGIPVAYCGTLIALYMLGVNIDLISVVGMILVLGILVDDAIIITERYIDNLEEGLPPKQAAHSAAKDLMLPVTGTILTTVFAFTPMVLIDSEISIIFFAVPVVIITSLAMSWFESFFILPNHLQHFVQRPPNKKSGDGLFAKSKKLYSLILNQILRFRYVMLTALLVFFGSSLWVAKNKIQQNFNFNVNLERIAVNITLKESDSLEFTEKKIVPFEEFMLTFPKEDISYVDTDIGRMWAEGRLYTGVRYGKIRLHINQNQTRPKEIKRKYTKLLKEYFAKNEDPSFEKIAVGYEMNDQDELKKSMVSIDVTGNEDVDYLSLKGSIEQTIEKEKLDLALVKEVNEFDEKWVFRPNSEKLARYRLSTSDISNQLRSFFVPHELMQVRINGESKWLYTQIEKGKTLTEKELNKMSVLNGIGLPVPLNKLGKWSKKMQLANIRHKDGKRNFKFDLSFLESEELNQTTAKEQAAKITDVLQKSFPTYSIELRDADRAETNSRVWALKVALLCIVLVMFTLALILGSVTLPFVVGLPIPFGLTGIIWALYLHDLPMGIMSLVGLIGTVGVSVNDSLIMVDQMLKKGKGLGTMTRQQIVEGASGRLRAIILTTVTTLGGVFPMAYAVGGESGFTEPLAFSLGWGLLFSTMFTLFALPAVVEVRGDVIALMYKIVGWVGYRKTNESSHWEHPQSLKEQPLESSLNKDGSSNESPNVQNENDRPPQAFL